MNWQTEITELFGIELPIVQGGLAYLAYADLAAAVSEAGGLGQITAMSLASPEELKKEIARVREKTSKPFSVNFAIGNHGRAYESMVEAALEENVEIISVTGGNPAPLFAMLEGTNVKKMVLVAAKRQAQKAEEIGADAVIAVGQEGGGHLGRDDIGTMVLIPTIADAVSIPVIGSGGIGDGRGWMAAQALGAQGIEMGTRFIATKECVDASPQYINALLSSTEQDTAVIKRTIGAPARALSNDWTTNILEMEEAGADYDKLKTYISGAANRKFIHDGEEQQGFGWAGQITGMIEDVPSVTELFSRMKQEAEAVRTAWSK